MSVLSNHDPPPPGVGALKYESDVHYLPEYESEISFKKGNHSIWAEKNGSFLYGFLKMEVIQCRKSTSLPFCPLHIEFLNTVPTILVIVRV